MKVFLILLLCAVGCANSGLSVRNKQRGEPPRLLTHPFFAAGFDQDVTVVVLAYRPKAYSFVMADGTFLGQNEKKVAKYLKDAGFKNIVLVSEVGMTSETAAEIVGAFEETELPIVRFWRIQAFFPSFYDELENQRREGGPKNAAVGLGK